MGYIAVGSALLACVGIAFLLRWRQRANRALLAQLRQTIRELEERASDSRRLASSLATALDGISLGVVIEDGAGHEVFRNEAASSMLGTGVGDTLISHALLRLIQSARVGQVSSEVLDLYGPPRRSLSISAVPLGEDGMTAAVIEDVSERRRLEAVRRDFVANVSHELKTPVGALGLLAETMADEQDIEVLHQLAERVQAEALRVARIIEDLLSLSRLEAEEAPRHDPVPLHVVLRSAIDQVQPAASLQGVKLDVVEPPWDWTVVGDRRQLVSALFHLVENAVKYSDQGSRVEVRSTTSGRCADVTVRDYGVGIPSRDLDRIFERFYRVDRGRSRHTGGTGLGLAIVRHVAHNHGGEVLVNSVEGEGSLFTLRVPLFTVPPPPDSRDDETTGQRPVTADIRGLK